MISGAILGMGIGDGFDQAGCSEDGSGTKSSCPKDGKVAMALGLGLFTGLIGAVIGGAIGHRTTFTF